MPVVEETCNFVSSWVEPKYIMPAIIALISSGLFPFFLHRYKVKRERQEKLFETIKSEYQNYFKIMEQAANLAGQDYKKFMSKTFPEAALELYRSESSPESIVNYQNTINGFVRDVQEGFQKTSHELVGLKVVCSSVLLDLLNNFERIYKEILSFQPKMLKEIGESVTPESLISGNFDFKTPTHNHMVALGQELTEVRDSIITRMRLELGYAS